MSIPLQLERAARLGRLRRSTRHASSIRQRGRGSRSRAARRSPRRSAAPAHAARCANWTAQQIRMPLHAPRPPSATRGFASGARFKQRAGDFVQPASVGRARAAAARSRIAARCVADPAAAHAASERNNSPPLDARSTSAARHHIEQALCFGGVTGAPRDRRTHARPPLADQRQNPRAADSFDRKLSSELVSSSTQVESVHCEPTLQLLARTRQQRPRQPAAREGRYGGHRGESRKACAAQQLQQDRLELIVLVMGRQQELARLSSAAQQRVARVTRRGLERLTARARDASRTTRERYARAVAPQRGSARSTSRVGMQP